MYKHIYIYILYVQYIQYTYIYIYISPMENEVNWPFIKRYMSILVSTATELVCCCYYYYLYFSTDGERSELAL